jgi:hypothetical protein
MTKPTEVHSELRYHWNCHGTRDIGRRTQRATSIFGAVLRSALLACLALLVLTPLYVLSVGPAIWLYEHGKAEGDTLDGLYAPLWWACELSPAIDQPVKWYTRRWISGRKFEFGPEP